MQTTRVRRTSDSSRWKLFSKPERSVLWPKRQIKEGFFLSTVVTKDGRVVSGYKVKEDDKSLTLRTPGAEAVEPVAKEQIKERADTGTLMPEGLTSWMSEPQRLDLLRYLFELGK